MKIIYKVTNTKDGNVYVGATSKPLEERRKEHLKKVNTTSKNKFHSAISTYGKESFQWEQVDVADSVDELAKKEKQYILAYNSKEDGLNSDEGGGVQKTVYQYDVLTGDLVAKHPTLSVAGSVINVNKNDLSKVCLSVNKICKGYYWSYDYLEKFIPLNDNRKKKVKQFTIKGIFIAEFNSVSEASKQTGCNKTSIGKVCRGERSTCGGYLWFY